jgi:hypothetical protein
MKFQPGFSDSQCASPSAKQQERSYFLIRHLSISWTAAQSDSYCQILATVTKIVLYQITFSTQRVKQERNKFTRVAQNASTGSMQATGWNTLVRWNQQVQRSGLATVHWITASRESNYWGSKILEHGGSRGYKYGGRMFTSLQAQHRTTWL